MPALAIGILTLILLGLLIFMRFRRPKPLGPNTEQLALSVWAAYGPYGTARDAEERLRQACKVVFGADGVLAHERWIAGHARNFHQWEGAGQFEKRVNMIRSALIATAYGPAFDAACKDMKIELRRGVLDAMERFNQGTRESGGPTFEAVEQEDGTLGVIFKQHRSDEDLVKDMVYKIGKNLFHDQCDQARELLAFLERVWQGSKGKPIDNPTDAGAAWLACYTEDSATALAQAFKTLNDAWAATRPAVE